MKKEASKQTNIVTCTQRLTGKTSTIRNEKGKNIYIVSFLIVAVFPFHIFQCRIRVGYNVLISMAAATRPCFFTRVVCHHPSTSQGYGNASRTTYVPRRAASRGLKNTSVVSLRRTGTHCLTCHSRSSQAKGWEDGLRRMAYAEGVRGVRTCWGGGAEDKAECRCQSQSARGVCVPGTANVCQVLSSHGCPH